MRICPWARICQHAPPLLSMSGTILFRGRLEIILLVAMLPEKKLEHNMVIFQNGRDKNLILTISPVLIDIKS